MFFLLEPEAPARPGLSFTLCVSAGSEPGGASHAFTQSVASGFSCPFHAHDDCGQAVCVKATAVEYKGYLIEAFEEWPRRWFANVRRLDDQAIPGTQSTSLRTFSVRPSKAAAIEFAKKVIDVLPLV